MPGRTLATWYGSGSDPTESTYQPLEPSFYSRPPLQPGSTQYEQQQHQYGYYPVNQGNPGSSSTYSDQQQRIFSPNYSQQQPPHFSPHSPASPVAPAGSYHYSNSLSSPTVGPVPAIPQHGMNYSNPQQQALYSSALSPGHYGSPNHGQHSGYSPSSSSSSGGGGNGGSSNSQQWQMQQSAGDYSQHHSSPSPQHPSVLTGSPSASSATTPSPSPAHTPTPAGSLHSPPPSLAMSGQYPAHHHGRHPPMGSPPQPSQGHNLPSWVHHSAGRGMNVHPGAGMSGPPPQGPGYYPPLHTGHGMQGPPQHAHMASSVPVPGDRRSPLHSPTPGSWNNLGSVASAATKTSGSHEGSGRGPPPPSSHPQQNNSGSSGGGGGVGGNPLFSLQMLVNQDINRNAAAASAAMAQANSYRASTPSATHQQETVDLSSAGSGAEVYSRLPPQQSGPIPLTRTDKQSPQVSLRNGSIITSTSSASSAVSNTNVTSPLTPLNGEVSSDSAVGSSATSTPSSQPEIPSSSAATPSTDINTKTVAPVADSKTVSVIAQTPPREKSKVSPHIPATGLHQSVEGKPESCAEECESGAAKGDSIETDKDSSSQVKERSVKPASEENLERCNPVIMSGTTDVAPAPREPASNIVSLSSSGSFVSKQSDDGLSVPSPSPGSKDSVSPVRSPKSGNPKRMKKVDSILENLVESGTKKLGGGSMGTAVVELPPQTPSATTVVVPASVIVSPVGTSEDSGSGLGRDARTPSPGAQQKQQPANRHKSPVPVREEDAVSPTSGGGDDSENGKPRRKRKLDKPVRVSKVSGEGEGEGEKETGFDEDIKGKDESQKLEGPAADENSETKEAAAVECAASTKDVEQDASTKPIEAVTVDAVSNQDLMEKQEPSRRRRSSESSAVSPSSAWPTAGQRTRRKSASDQQEDNGSSNAGDLLSVLVSNQHDKNTMGDSKPEVKNAFIEVETELEKMFAGIVEPEECVDPLKLDTASPIPMEVSPASKALDSLTSIDSAASVGPKPASGLKSRGRPKGSRNGARRSSESIFGPSSTDSTPKKKKKKQSKRSADDSLSLLQKKIKRTKLFQGENGDDSPVPRKKGLIKGESMCRDGPLQSVSVYDSSSNTSSSRSRGPMIHIEGPRDNPYHVSVVNAPFRGEDEDGGERGGSKKQSGTANRRKTPSYHNDLDYRGKMTGSGSSASGMFSSTLSLRYDAHTTDRTWICVFCKSGPHCGVGGGGTSGDLFGPYLLTPPDKLDMNADGSADERDITEEQKLSGGRNKRSLRGAHMVEQFCQKMSRKVQRSHSLDGAPVLGMVPVSSNGGDGKEDGCYEVWVHEECAVWAAGVHVVGSRIVGLREAVWSAVHTVCSKCGEGGANVGCVRRGCEWRLHYGCAREQGWELDEEAYIARCAQHKKGVYSSEEAILPT